MSLRTIILQEARCFKTPATYNNNRPSWINMLEGYFMNTYSLIKINGSPVGKARVVLRYRTFRMGNKLRYFS